MATPTQNDSTLSVLQVLPELNTGGVERGTIEIARALVAAGHQSTILSNGGYQVDTLLQEGSQHITLPVHRKSLLSLRLVNQLREVIAPFDVVHIRSRMPAWLIYLAWRKMPVATRPRLISTVHGLYSVSRYSAVMTKAERVIAISEVVRDYIFDNYPDTPEARVQLIYRGVTPDEFVPGYQPSDAWLEQWYSAYPSSRNRKILLMPARITRWKGHEAYLRLIAGLCRRLDVHGVVVGEHGKRQARFFKQLQQQCWDLGIEDHVSFVGNRRDMVELYALADLSFNLSTHAEPFGRTMIESMSIGTPVVAWNYGGASEILRELFPAGLVPVQDEDALLATCLKLLTQPEQPSPNSFTLERMQQQTLQAYVDLAASPREDK